MNGAEIPAWFYKVVALIVFWLVGQVVAEWIKHKMKKEVIQHEWTGEERRQTIVIDDELLSKFLGAYKDHIQVVEKLLESSRVKNDLLAELSRGMKEHIEAAEESRKLLKKVHDKLVFG